MKIRFILILLLAIGAICVKAQNTLFKLPFPTGTKYTCTQGNAQSPTHKSKTDSEFAFDFYMPIGTPICATRSGKARIGGVIENFEDKNCPYDYVNKECPGGCVNDVNRIVIDHGDGTSALYLHLTKNGSLVSEGQWIGQGDTIGYSGQSGCSTGAHLHLMVMTTGTSWYEQSKQISFYDVSSNNGIPTKSNSYTSGIFISPICSNIDIYGGSISNPKTIKIWYKRGTISDGTDIQNFKIGSKIISINNIYDFYYNASSDIQSFYVQLSTGILSGLQNRSYDISFSVGEYFFKGKNQIYFQDPKGFSDVPEDAWYFQFVTQGVELGLFKGFYTAPSSYTFAPASKMTRAEACKVIVGVAIKLGLEIDTRTDINGMFSDVPLSHWAFPYIQTLRNKGYIDPGTLFNPDINITMGQFAKILCNGLSISNASVNTSQINNNSGILGSIIKIQTTDPNLQTYLDRLSKIVDVDTDENGNKFVRVLMAGGYEVSNNELNSGTQITVSGDADVKRAVMAKILLSSYNFKKNSNKKSTANVSKYIVIGDHFELPTTLSGTKPASVSQSYTIESGSQLTLGANADTWGGSSLFFYWVADGGSLQSLYPNNRKVTFTAPTVATNTNYQVYLLMGTANGKVGKAVYTITVTPKQAPQTPTVQATNISFSNVTTTALTVNWTRGNGQFCIVACNENIGTSDDPVNNQSYTGNANFTSAPLIKTGSITKVVYTGTGNSVYITGLKANTTYKIKVFEYNSNAQGITYLLTNPAWNNVRSSSYPAIDIDFSWSLSQPLVNNALTFTATGNNNTNLSWTFPNANISTSTGNSVSNVIYSTAGSYNITLTATNSLSGESKTVVRTVTIYTQAQLDNDFSLQNVKTNPIGVIANSSIAVTCDVINSGLNNAYLNDVGYVISQDDIWDDNDYHLGVKTINSVINTKDILQVSNNLTIPIGYAAGTYYLIAKVDPSNMQSESSKNNNTSSTQFQIIASYPDFTVNNVSLPKSVFKSGEVVTSTVEIKNIGVGICQYCSFFTAIYISKDNIFDNNDMLLNSNSYIETINPNSSATLNVSCAIPDWFKTGNYYLFVLTDNDFRIPESNETNNKYAPISITISNPTQPTINATKVTLSNLTANSLRVSWQNGDGQNRIVVACKGQIGYRPADGSSYTFNSDFSLAPGIKSTQPSMGVVVYNGNGNSIDVTNLTPNETYYFTVYEYNGNSTTSDYLQGEFCSSFAYIGTVSSINGWDKIYNGSATWKKVKFIDLNNGFLIDNDIFAKTKDGGKTWSVKEIFPYQLKYDMLSFTFINNSLGWLVGNYGIILKTTDGGETWNIQNSNTENYLYDVCFKDESIGIVGTSTGILRTTNGGTSWSFIPTSKAINNVILLNNSTGFAGGMKLLLKTTDNGVTWNSTNSDVSNYNCSSFSFSSNSIGFTTSSFASSNILKTENLGTSWNFNYLSSLNSIDFFSGLRGVAVGNSGKIIKTDDGGNTWSDILNITTNKLNSVDFVDESTVYLAGSSILLKTTTNSQSQFINAPIILSTNICVPSLLEIPYTIQGNFTSGNIFSAQLSDDLGNFTNPTIIGVIQSISSGIISCNIPAGILSGNNYRIRIVSSNPICVGASTSSSISINPRPVLSFSEPALDSYLTTNPIISLSGSPVGGVFKIDNNVATQINFASLNIGNHNVSYSYSSFGCSNTLIKSFLVTLPHAITINNLNPTSYCAGGILTVNYVVQGAFNADNNFIVELSNSSGSFTNPVIINSIAGISSGSIVCQIPVLTSQSSLYKLRVSSTNPKIVGSSSNTFSINSAVVPSITIQSNKTSICAGNNVLFTAVSSNAGSSPFYQWKINSTNSGTNSAGFSTNTLQNTDEVSLELTSNANCAYPKTVYSNAIKTNVNTVFTPFAEIFATTTTIQQNEIVDFMAIVENSGSAPIYQWFVNNINQNINSPFFTSSSLQNNDIVKVSVTSNESCITTATVMSQVTMTVSNITTLIEKESESDITIYPNPSAGQCFLSIKNEYTGQIPITVYSSLGVKLKSIQFVKSEQTLNKQIDLSSYTSGLYFITVHSSDYKLFKVIIDNNK